MTNKKLIKETHELMSILEEQAQKYCSATSIPVAEELEEFVIGVRNKAREAKNNLQQFALENIDRT